MGIVSIWNYIFAVYRGRFAKVSLVRHCESGEVSAAKIIRRWRCGKDTLASIMQEIDMVKIGHQNPHIVKMKHYYVGDKEVVLLLEKYVIGGNLKSCSACFS